MLALLGDEAFQRGDTNTAYLEQFVEKAPGGGSGLRLSGLPAEIPAVITAVLYAHSRQGAGKAVVSQGQQPRSSPWLDSGRREALPVKYFAMPRWARNTNASIDESNGQLVVDREWQDRTAADLRHIARARRRTRSFLMGVRLNSRLEEGSRRHRVLRWRRAVSSRGGGCADALGTRHDRRRTRLLAVRKSVKAAMPGIVQGNCMVAAGGHRAGGAAPAYPRGNEDAERDPRQTVPATVVQGPCRSRATPSKRAPKLIELE